MIYFINHKPRKTNPNSRRKLNYIIIKRAPDKQNWAGTLKAIDLGPWTIL